ncbi:MAG: glycosyltransferase family A protein, partial [Mariprofundus sp.]|nr:glycosyltransferase family A protein [Mariprofundus sp.]
MQELSFSIIIPVYNRPQEVEELLTSLQHQDFKHAFEVVIIEDGSTHKADAVVKKFSEKLDIKYLYKENSGPGLSRNFGMQQAKGNYFIILDSDVIL